MKKKEKWFFPTKKTNWKKSQKASTRRANIMESVDKRLTMHNRYILAARRIQAISNVTEDNPTARLAKLDATYFFKKASKVD